MKKILLLTWYKNYNYGTALQAYSLQKVIKDSKITGINTNDQYLADECYLLPYMPKRKTSMIHKMKKALMFSTYVKKWEQRRDRKIYKANEENFKKRENAFLGFISENYKLAANHEIQVEELESIVKTYDIVMAGSDQIWNPEALDSVYLMEWVPDDKRKISYASSLSTTNIPEQYYPIYKRALSRLKAISIRDTACREQLEKIVGKDIKTVVDPVILLGADELKAHTKKIDSKPYVFAYFLGNNFAHREFTVQYANDKKLDIHAIINVGSDFEKDKILEKFADWEVDPWKFVSYINDADMVITDSFHATVISVLLHKNFAVLEKDSSRPEQNNRIKEFLALVGLEECWCPENNQAKNISEDKWLEVDKKLYRSREESLRWLMEAIKC